MTAFQITSPRAAPDYNSLTMVLRLTALWAAMNARTHIPHSLDLTLPFI